MLIYEAHFVVILPMNFNHYDDVIMGTIAPQITSLTIVYSTVYSGADQSKHQSSASLAFVWGIHRWPVNSPHKWSVTRKMFPFDDVIMNIFNSMEFWVSRHLNAHAPKNRFSLDRYEIETFFTQYSVLMDISYHVQKFEMIDIFIFINVVFNAGTNRFIFEFNTIKLYCWSFHFQKHTINHPYYTQQGQ